ncbi:uncharacterized protein LOC106868210 [Octopus bimaculoides]|uniref:uncharacterized protein LOC106868210 n=1 Tax=Octopus bimaculoides TaxID=37653 RepID=UPI00071DFC11|nr:uncharacterized protein LOC106868210 [Octopus bimaculoides]|eukprot:XP_014768858.1 PREDICTED: uncharacterized protein LOC106868210 [Octopus bimaculoides]
MVCCIFEQKQLHFKLFCDYFDICHVTTRATVQGNIDVMEMGGRGGDERGQNRLFIAFNELKNTTYSVKVSGCKENIPTFQCAENILSCLLPQCEAGRKSVQLYDEKGSKEPLLTSSILIVTAESLVLDIFEYYKSCKSPGINYRAFTESKNIFKDLHGIYQETLSNLLRDTLNVSTTEDERPPLPERKHRIQLRPTANQISYSRRRAEIGQYVDYRGVPQIRIRNQRSNHQKLINRQKISSYLDNIVPPILPKRINERP